MMLPPKAARLDPSGPPPRQFGNAVHCLRLDRDGLVYVCDRSNSRFGEIFRKDGSFLKEIFIATESPDGGGRWLIWIFSPDYRNSCTSPTAPDQKVWILLSRADSSVPGWILVSAAPALGNSRRRCTISFGRFEGQHLHRRSGHRRPRAEVLA